MKHQMICVLVFITCAFAAANHLVAQVAPLQGNHRSFLAKVLIDEAGKCSVSVVHLDDPDPDLGWSGTSDGLAEISLAGIGGAKVFTEPDGRGSVRYDFTTLKSVESLFDQKRPSTVDSESFRLAPKSSGLLLIPKAVGHHQPSRCLWTCPRQVRLPVEVRVVLPDFEAGSFGVGFDFLGEGNQIASHLDVELYSNTGTFSGNYFEIADPQHGRSLLSGSYLHKSDSSRSAILPIDESERHQPVNVVIGAFGYVVCIRQLEIDGRIAARIGVQLQKRGEKVVMTNVSEGPASKAGVREGDVLEAINSTSVVDIAAAEDSMSKLPVGQEATLSVLRGSDRIDIKVVPE